MRFRLLIFISIVVAGLVVPSGAEAQLRDYLPEWLGGNPTPRRQSTPAPPRSTPSPQFVCLGTTSTRDLAVENALRQPLQNSYAMHWSRPGWRERFAAACERDVVSNPPMNRANTSAVRAVASLSNRHVDRNCIRQAIRHRANDNIEANRTMCAPRARQTNEGTPCLSDRYVDFIHFTINSALRCLQSRDNPLDPDTIFEMFNHESAFMGFVNNNGGVGLAQMTSSGVRGAFNPGHGGRENLDALMSRPEKRGFCDPFRRLVTPLGRESIPICDYTGIDNGIARSAIAGIGLLSYYQIVMRNALDDAGIRTSHPQYSQILRTMSLISYNSGETDAMRLLDQIKGTLRTSSNPVAYIRQQATRRLGKSYVGAMEISRSQVQGIPRSCATTSPL